jgi:hypothetical protein
MDSISTNPSRISEAGAMRFAHRLFMTLAIILVVLAEAFIVANLLGQRRVPMDLFTTSSLVILVIVPMTVGFMLYNKMKKAASCSPTNQLGWPLVRLIWTLFLFISYSSMVMLIMTLLGAGSRLKG